MAARTLPLEIFARVLQHIRVPELPLLCRLNKSYQRVAERKLYSNLVLGDANIAFHVCMALLRNDGVRGAYVKRFWFWVDVRRTVSRVQLPMHFWKTIQLALVTMTELKDLLIHDPIMTNTWILDPEELDDQHRFQLHHGKFRLVWDANLVAFLKTQTQLKYLMTLDATDITQVESMPAGYLQALETYEGPLLVAAELLRCPRVTHMRVAVDEEVSPLLAEFIEGAVTLDTPLRSLHFSMIPEQFLGQALEALTSEPKWCAGLKYLGVIPMPWVDHNIIHRHLLKLHNLQCIAFDVSHLEPAPIEVMQRTLTLEMHIYCPSLHRVVFWFGPQINLWIYHQQVWTSTGLHQFTHADDHLWLSV
ncbi:hypothetical protein EUX98_g2594 [Antrodiella citrinella]|uniref:F-box domain-containing protein n=1 Tax=Antrodiella citrinella TaxID=2447956 RepID=A0A4V3XJ45_9APHY|nr:hypothetical protein EUX98_g2594 [Antrodiella citrinella]